MAQLSSTQVLCYFRSGLLHQCCIALCSWSSVLLVAQPLALGRLLMKPISTTERLPVHHPRLAKYQ